MPSPRPRQDAGPTRGDWQQLRRQLHHLESLGRERSQEVAREVDSALFLHALVRPARYVPSAGGWGASYETLAYLVDHILNSESDLHVVELGSGVSTAWRGLACKIHGRSKITSFEHEELYYQRTARLVEGHALEGVVDLVYSPLKPIVIEGVERQWYSIGLERVGAVNLLFVDGPPGSTGPEARNPALSQLVGALADRATIVVDDTNRQGEADMVAAWIAAVEGAGDRLRIVETISRSTVLTFERRSN